MKRLLFTLACLAVVILSCSEDNSSYFSPSDELIDSNVNFQVIDTISFNMSTFKIDSLKTDTDSKILVGRYVDPTFGKVVCNGFVNFLPGAYNVDDEMVFDSIVLNLKYSGYYYNDTVKQKKIKIFKLDKKLDYLNGQENFYNTSDFPASTTIGEKTFYPRIAKDSLKITLNYTFGQNIFNKIRDGVINNDEELGQYFKGLKISPDDLEDASILSFDVNNSHLRFYYSDPDESDKALYYDFYYTDLNTNRNHFTQVRCDRTGTILPVNFINQENEFNSRNTDNLTFIQAGEGIVTKISFPNFKESIANLNMDGTIFKANLKIPLKRTSYTNKLYTSDSLRVFIIDQNNNIVSETKNAHIKLEDAEFNQKYINILIEPYLNKVLQNNYYKKYGLMLLPYDYGSATTRLLLNDNHNTDEKTKLILTYLTYDN